MGVRVYRTFMSHLLRYFFNPHQRTTFSMTPMTEAGPFFLRYFFGLKERVLVVLVGILSNAILTPFVSQPSPADILTLIDEEETTILSLNQPVGHNVILYGKGQ